MVILRPLYLTSWLLDDFLSEHQDFAADAVVISSASSKTAIGLAHTLARRAPAGKKPLAAVGLTSAARADFVRSLGLYSRVVTYESLLEPEGDGSGDGSGGGLDDGNGDGLGGGTKSVFVDIAGNVSVLNAVHTQLGADLVHSCSVGLSHRDAHNGGHPPAGLPGPRPRFFFAPEWVARRAAEREGGFGALRAEILPAWHDFVADSARWLSIQHVHGSGAILRGYASAAAGKSRPTIGTVMSL